LHKNLHATNVEGGPSFGNGLTVAWP